MRNVRCAFSLLLIFGSTSVWAQSDVSILDSWVVDGTYATQDATFNVSAGTDRLVLVALSAEKNGSGPMSVASVSLGDQVLTEIFDFTVGGSGGYHNLNWLGYLPESQIAARSGSVLTIQYANTPSDPFDEPKIYYASYEHVDQAAPIAGSSNNTNTNASSLQLNGNVTSGDGGRIVGFNVLGQHYNPGVSTAGYSEASQSIGANNGHASGVYDRAVTTGVTENPTFTTATSTRMAVSAVALKRAEIDVIDVDPPSPDPMSWATEPFATGSSSISMTATTATDANGVEYLFLNTGGGNDSGWQSSSTYEDTGLLPDTSYSYTVTARDTSVNQNTTLASVERIATTGSVDLSPDVAILDPWVVDGSYAAQDAIFNVRSGSNRLVLVALSAEKNGSGPMSVTSVSLGGQVLTEVFDFTVGGSGGYHNLNWLGYLPESQIDSAGADPVLTIQYANTPSDPFDGPKIHYASYENVDQAAPIAGSSNNTGSASSLQLSGALTASDGGRIVGFNVLGQHYNPGVSTAGYIEASQSIGANNGHASGVYDRAVTTVVTENPTFTTATSTRMAVSAVALNKAVVVSTDPPEITSNGGGAAAGISVAENTTAVTTVTATDPDTPQGNLSYSLSGADQSAFAIGSTTGVLTFNSAPDFDIPGDANGDNDYLVTVAVSDGVNSDSQDLTVTVDNVNEAPTANSQSVNTNEDTPIAITLTGSDPEGTALSFTVGSPSSGSLSGTAPNLTYTPNSNFFGNDSFTFTVSDGSLTSSAATVSITVVALNDDPPVITSNGGGAAAGVNVAENTTGVTTVTATDLDTPQGSLTYGLGGGADQSAFAIGSSTGVLTFNSAPDFDIPGDANGDNIYQVTVTVSDGVNSDSQALTVTVSNVNEAPVADNQPVSTDEDTSVAITLTGSDPEGTALSFNIAGGPANGTLSGTGATRTYTPASQFAGSDSFTFTASDGSLTSNPATVSITVVAINDDPPVITSNGGGAAAGVSVAENTTGVTTVTATDPDTPQGELTFGLGGGADQSAFTIGSSSGVLTFNSAPDFDIPGDFNGDNNYQVTVTVSDGVNGDNQNLTVTVDNVNEAPTAINQFDSTSEDTAVVITLTGSDPEGTSLSFNVVSGPSDGSLSGSGTTRTYTPNGNFFGGDSFTFTASDGSLTSNTATASITVTPVNDDPVANDDDFTSTPVNKGGSLNNLNVLGNDFDPEGSFDVTSVTITGQTNGTATPNGDGSVDFTHDDSATTVASFSYTVDDTEGATSNVATVSLAVDLVADITLDTNFDSASISSHSINGNVIDLTLRTEQISNNTSDYTYWANFKLSNVSGKDVTLRFTGINAVPFLSDPGSNENQMVYSCDGAIWDRLTQHSYSSGNGGTYTVTQTFACDDVQIATFFPFSYERMQSFIDTVSLSQWATLTYLGPSEQGRDIDLLTITDTAVPASSKRHIYIPARLHAAETSSSHMLEGLIDFLIGNIPDAQVMRQNFVFHIVPMANPDGVSLGNSRATSELRDANRDWNNSNSVEITTIRNHLNSINNSFGVDMFIDWHSQMNDLSWFNFIYAPSGNGFFSILSDWTGFDSQNTGGTSCSSSSCSSRGYTTTQLGLFNFVFEPTPHLVTWTIAGLQLDGISTAYAITEYFGVSLDINPPTPDTMSWVTPPTATGSSSITMTASPASHSNDVEYFFDNTAGGGNDSGWQLSNVYQDTGLQPDTEYTYTVVARDQVNLNQNNASAPASATTESAGGGGLTTFRDEFNSVSFSGSDGTGSWGTDWLEIGESNGAASGDIRVASNQSDTRLRVKDNDNGGEGVQRELDLTGFVSATLTFDYRRNNLISADDYVTVDISADGGNSWTELDRFQGPDNDGGYTSTNYDITAYISADTRIRFLGSPLLGNRQRVWFDNVEIAASSP